MKKIFINLPVKDVEISLKFYTQLGFKIRPLFSDENQKCMVWSEEIYVMLMSHEQFRRFIKKNIPDIKDYASAYFTLPVESFERVNEIADSGKMAGGTEPIPMTDHGFMQLRRIEDHDGHTWDIIYLDESKFRKE